MPIPRTITLLALAALILSACAPASSATSTPLEIACGDGICSPSEDEQSCPKDCQFPSLSGKVLTTYITSEAVGDIAVLVAYPQVPRFPEGAGVVLVIPPVFTPADGFFIGPDFTSIGLIQVTFLWPGRSDSLYEVQSAGQHDYGGDLTSQVLRDVIRFTAGRLSNINDRPITTLIPVKPLVDEVGIYAFGDAGMVAVDVLASYGDQLTGVEYMVGHENPTLDSLAALEAGYTTAIGLAVLNPFYNYPASYSPLDLILNYGTLRWEPAYTDEDSPYVGRPYLDLDGNNQLDETDFLFSSQVPEMFGRRYYSMNLTQALLDNDALSLDSWPSTLATPDQAAQAWSALMSPTRYIDLALMTPNLKVMLLFARRDHAQVAVDKPHIHQAFQGFRFAAFLRWVRLNPDASYLEKIISPSLDFPDHPANTQPEDWLDINSYAYDGSGSVAEMAPLAALAEMSDRAHTFRWDENLGTTLYDYITPTPQP